MAKTTCEQLAQWAMAASWESVRPEAAERIKLHLLDALGCAVGALRTKPIDAIRREQAMAGVGGECTQIADGNRTSPEYAAFYNSALVRYLDFMDTYVAPGEACHPSDNLGAVLAGADLAGASGRDFLTALLVAYQVQCRLTGSGVPIMRRGFDHTIQLAVSQTAGLCRVLGLSNQQAAHAIAISTAGGLGLAASRAGNPVPQWKGMAAAATAFSTVHNTRLARAGITGPLGVFESPLGLEHMLGEHFKINWSREELDAVLSCSIKRYNAEFHAQSCIDGLIEMREKYAIAPAHIRTVEIEIFKVAYEMIGGGKYVDPKSVSTKEDADHSLHYLAAVALVDGKVGPPQFEEHRIRSGDVQTLLARVTVKPNFIYTKSYPGSMRVRMNVAMQNGKRFVHKKKDYAGFYRRPMTKDEVVAKFRSLAAGAMDTALMRQIETCVFGLENRAVAELLHILETVPLGGLKDIAA